MKVVNETKAREAFEQAIGSYVQEFNHFFLAKLFGLDIRYEENACIVEFDVEDYMFNPQGSLHGGIISFAMDVSMGHLLNHLGGPGITLEMKVQFMQPVRSGKVRAVGTIVKKGRKICFLRSEMYDSEQNLIAHATSTWKLL